MVRGVNAAFVALFLGATMCGCGGGGSQPTTPTPPPPTTVSLNGTAMVTGGERIPDATIVILDGPNQGRTTTTNSNGEYTFDGLTRGNANLSAKKMPMYGEVAKGLYIDGGSRFDFVFPTPACRTNNTAWVSFENHSTQTEYAIIWDGFLAARLSPGGRSDKIVVAAGAAHRLDFENATTHRLACATSYPVPIQCSDWRYWCEYNAVVGFQSR